MKQTLFRKGLFLSFCLSFALLANAGGFQVWDQTGRAVGDYATSAATADDATTAWYNPAGLTKLKHQAIAVSVIGDYLQHKFTGSIDHSITGVPGTAFTLSGSAKANSMDAGATAMYALPINKKLAFGLSITFPFAYGFDFGRDSIVRYASTKNNAEVIDIGPSIAFQPTKYFSVSFGLDAQHMTAEVDNIDTDVTATDDTTSQNSFSDTAFGWNAGLLVNVTKNTRVGLTYRSQVVHHLAGESKLEGPLSGHQLYKSRARVNVTLPPSTALSLYQQVNSKLSLTGTINYTQWSKLYNLTVTNTAGAGNAGQFVTQNITIHEHMRNSWRFAIGAAYQLTPKWLIRGGTGFDESPSNKKEYRNVNSDGSRYVVAIGTGYKFRKNMSVDVGYTHQFVKKSSVTSTQQYGSTEATLDGHNESSVDEVGAQFNWAF